MSALPDRYIESLRLRGFAPATLVSREASVRLFLDWLGEGVDVRAVTRADVDRYALALRKRGYAMQTVHVRLIGVRAFFAFLEETDAVLVNPCAALVLPKLPSRLPRRVLTPKEAKRLLAVPDVSTEKGLRDQAILELFYSTGLRLAEMAALTVYDVDWREGYLRVNKGKGGKGRIVPLGEKARQALRRYVRDVRPRWRAKAAEPSDALWLTVDQPHGPMLSATIYTEVKKLGKKIGLHVTPHAWRHSCATHLVSAGANLLAVQRQLGHRSLRTTQVYTRVSVPDLKRTLRTKHPRRKAKP